MHSIVTTTTPPPPHQKPPAKHKHTTATQIVISRFAMYMTIYIYIKEGVFNFFNYSFYIEKELHII